MGVSNVARKITKGYVGVSGVARVLFKPTLKKVSNACPNFTQARFFLGATTIGNYAVFGGGTTHDSSSSANKSNVDAYDSSFVKTNPTSLSIARNRMGSTYIGNYALFAGGTNYSAFQSRVDIYDTSLTRTTTSLSKNMGFVGSATVGDYAVFAEADGAVNVFTANLTRSTPAVTFTTREKYVLGGKVGDYALFAGGYGGGATKKCEGISSTLVKVTCADLTTAISNGAAASSNSYYYVGNWTTIDKYDSSLVKTQAPSLTVNRNYMIGAGIKDLAIFAGGTNANAVEYYDSSGTRNTAENLSSARGRMQAATLGNYVIFGGGGVNNSASAVVDTYEY